MLQDKPATTSVILWAIVAVVAILVKLFCDKDVAAVDFHEDCIDFVRFRGPECADLE